MESFAIIGKVGYSNFEYPCDQNVKMQELVSQRDFLMTILSKIRQLHSYGQIRSLEDIKDIRIARVAAMPEDTTVTFSDLAINKLGFGELNLAS